MTIDAIIDGSRLQEIEFAVNAVVDDGFKILVGGQEKNGTHKLNRSF